MENKPLVLKKGMEISEEELNKIGWTEVGGWLGSRIILGNGNARCLYDKESKKTGRIFSHPPKDLKKCD